MRNKDKKAGVIAEDLITKKAKAFLNERLADIGKQVEQVEKIIELAAKLPGCPPPPPYMQIVEHRSFLLGQKEILEGLSKGATLAEEIAEDDDDDSCDCDLCRLRRGEDLPDGPGDLKKILEVIGGIETDGPEKVAEKIRNMKGIPDA